MNLVHGCTARREIGNDLSKSASIFSKIKDRLLKAPKRSFHKVKHKSHEKLYDFATNPYVLRVGIPVGLGALSYAASNLLNKVENTLDQKKVKKNIKDVATQMAYDPEFKGKAEKVISRFGEIASISPSVAQNPILAKPFIKKTLNKGLEVKDIQDLVNVEARTMTGKRPSFLSHVLNASEIENRIAPLLAEELPKAKGRIDTFLSAKSTEKRPLISEKYPNIGARVTNREYLREVIKPTIEAYEKHHGSLPTELEGLNLSKDFNLVQALDAINKYPKLQEKLLPYKVDLPMKKKSSPNFLKTIDPSVRKALAATLAAAGIGAGFGAVQEGAKYIQTKKENKKLRDSWDKTLDRLKGLEVGQETTEGYKTKKKIEQAGEIFRSLSNFAPGVAKDPVLGASVINGIMEMKGRLDPSAIKTLVDIQKGMSQVQESRSPFAQSPFMKGLASGFNIAGGSEAAGGITHGIGRATT